MLERIINVFLRSATLLSKFALVFFLAKFLEPHEVGLYGLLVVTIGYALFAIGFEFYTYSTREMLGSDKGLWLALIRDQSIFYIFIYIMIFPFLFIIFFKGLLPWSYVGYFFLLLFLEHVAQEINRLLVVMSEQLLASTILFLRGGAWSLLLILLMWLFPLFRRLEWVLVAWSLGAGSACLLGVSRILKLNKSSLSNKVDWQWIAKGFKTAVPFLIASLAIRGVFTFDRYWVESVAGLDVLGAYVLFAGIAAGVVAFLDAGVIVFLYPKIVTAAKSDNDNDFRNGMRKLSFDVILVTFVLVMFALFFSRVVISWIGKEFYIDNYFLLKWMLLAIVFYAISMIPHVGLYAKGRDKTILFSQLCGLLVFCLTGYLCVPHYGVIAVPWALCSSFLSMLIWKLFTYYIMCNNTDSLLNNRPKVLK